MSMNNRFALSLAVLCCSSAVIGQRVDNAEYYWDTDPGVGSAFSMSAVDGGFDAAVESIFLQTTTLPGGGAHTLGLRVRDQQGNWGPTFTTVVVIEPSVVTIPEMQVTQAEYFWDGDPGEGNGTPMIAFDGDFNDALEAISMETGMLPPNGIHVLNVRALDVNGAWSLPFRVVVEVLGGVVTFPEISVSAAEYFVNVDPGAGLGTPMLAVNGAFDDAFEAIRGGGIPAPVAAGANVLWMRARDVNQQWGPAFGIVVNIDTTITGTVGLTDDRSMVAHIAPNPARAEDGFVISFDRLVGDAELSLWDGAGRLILSKRMRATLRTEVELPGVAPGMYHLGIVVDGDRSWHGLLVQ